MKRWKLHRVDDGLQREATDAMFIEWNEDDTGKDIHADMKIGRSLILSPFNVTYTWMTTPITEIIKNDDYEKEFKTKNSHYILKYETYN